MDDGIDLYLQTRSSSSNLFLRLFPSVVEQLYGIALCNTQYQGEEKEEEEKEGLATRRNTEHLSSWSIAEEQGNSKNIVDFLPLKLIISSLLKGDNDNDDEEASPISVVYGSYNGGSPSTASPSNTDVMEVPSDFLPPSPTKPTLIYVKPLSKIYNAKTIQLKPLSNSDWEYIEIYSDFLESGGLLSQVSVVYPLQVLKLRLSGGEEEDAVVVKVQVLESGFGVLERDDENEEDDGEGEDDDDDDSTIAYSSSSDSSLDDNEDGKKDEGNGQSPNKTQYNCLRLVADTQVIVIPVPRLSTSPTATQEKEGDDKEEKYHEPSQPLRIEPTREDFIPTFEYFSRFDDDHNDSPKSDLGVGDSDDRVIDNHKRPLPSSPPCLSVYIHSWTFSHCVPGASSSTTAHKNSDDENYDGVFALIWRSPTSLSHPTETFFDPSGGDESGDEVKPKQTSAVPSIISNNKDDVAVVRVYTSDHISHGSIAIHTDVRHQLGVSPLYDKVHIQLLTSHQIHSNIATVKEALCEGRMKVNLSTVLIVTSEQDANQQECVQPWCYPDDFIVSGPCGGRGSDGTITTRPNNSTSTLSSSPIFSSSDHPIEFEDFRLVSPGSLIRISLPNLKRDNSLSRFSGSILQQVTFDTLKNNSYGNKRGNNHFVHGNDNKISVSRSTNNENRNFLGVGPHLSGLPPFLSINDLSEAVEFATALSDQSLDVLGKDVSKMTTIQQRMNWEATFLHGKSTKYVRMPKYEQMLNLLPQTSSFFSLHKKTEGIIRHLHRGNMAFNDEQPDFVSDKHRPPKASYLDGILITGEHGSGKTQLTILISAAMRVQHQIASVYLDCKRLQSSTTSRLKDILNEMTAVFRTAYLCRPCVLVLDNLDSLLPNIDASDEDDDGSIHHVQQVNPMVTNQVKVIADHFNMLKEVLGNSCDKENASSNKAILPGPSTANRIVLLCTSQSCNSLFCAARSTGSYSLVIGVPNIDASERVELFADIAFQRDHQKDAKLFLEELMPDFGEKTEGYRAHDIKVVASRARHLFHIHALGRENISAKTGNSNNHYGKNSPLLQGCLFPNRAKRDIFNILSDYTPLSHQRVRLKKTSSTDWLSIGGLFKAKAKLNEIIIRPVKYSLLYKHAPITLPRGILLFGPPGCGKSYLVPALAKKCNLNLVTCNGPELLDKYIGASEAKVRDLFAQAQMASPAMLFLDEFDALAPRRGTDHTGVTDRVVNQLLTFLDGVENVGKKGSVLYIVAATSRPDKIDPALLRPGRLEKHVYVGFPESANEWNDIFFSMSKHRDIDEETKNILANKQLLDIIPDLVRHAKMFSSADMKGVFDTAHLNAVHDYLKIEGCNEAPVNVQSQHEGGSKTLDEERVRVTISKSHLMHALKSTRPSLSDSDRQMFQRVCGPFLKNDLLETIHQRESLQVNDTSTLVESTDTHTKEGKDHPSSPSISYKDIIWDDMTEHSSLPSKQKQKLRTTLR